MKLSIGLFLLSIPLICCHKNINISPVRGKNAVTLFLFFFFFVGREEIQRDIVKIAK